MARKQELSDGLALRVWRPEALAAAENRVTAAM